MLMPRRRPKKDPSPTATPKVVTLQEVYDAEQEILRRVKEGQQKPLDVQQASHVEKEKVAALKSEIEALQERNKTANYTISWLAEGYEQMENVRYGECFGLECLFDLLNAFFVNKQYTDEQIMRMIGIKDLDRKELLQQYNKERPRKNLDPILTDEIWGKAHRSDKTLAKIWWLDNAHNFIQDRETRNRIAKMSQAQGAQNSNTSQTIPENNILASRIRAL